MKYIILTRLLKNKLLCDLVSGCLSEGSGNAIFIGIKRIGYEESPIESPSLSDFDLHFYENWAYCMNSRAKHAYI